MTERLRERQITEALIEWCKSSDVTLDIEALTELVKLVKHLSER